MKALLCIDGSEHSASAVFAAARVLGPTDQVIIFCGTKAGPKVQLEPFELIARAALDVLQKQSAVLAQNISIVVDAVPSHNLRQPSIKQAIVALADDSGADLVICGSRGLGMMKRLALGSVSDYVVSHVNSAAVLVVHQSPVDHDSTKPFRAVALADGSPSSLRAAQFLGHLINPGDDVIVLEAQKPAEQYVVAPGVGGPAVFENPNFAKDQANVLARSNRIGQDTKDAIVRSHAASRKSQKSLDDTSHIEARLIVSFDAADGLHKHLDNNRYDIVAIGCHGHNPVARALVGGTCTSILHDDSQAAVLVVRA